MIKQSKNGFVLLGSIFVVLFLGILIGVAVMRSDIQFQAVNNRVASQKSFYAAETGLETALFNFRHDLNWQPGIAEISLRTDKNDPGSVIGTYLVKTAPAGDFNNWPTIWVHSTGWDPDHKISRTILARIIVFNPTSFSISTLGDLHIGSGAVYDDDILARDIFFEVNESISDDDLRRIFVDGDVNYLRSVSGENNPSVEISGDVQKFPSITFSGVDIERYRTLAQNNGKYINGDFDYSGPISYADLFDNHPDPALANGVVFAEGDIHISGTYSESMLIVSGGSIFIEGNIETLDPGGQPQLGLFANRDVIIPDSATVPDNLTIMAYIVADGDEDSKGVFEAKGPKFSKQQLDFFGAVSVRGETGDELRTAIDLNVFSVRNYQYNEELRNNTTIPFVSYIANIIEWKEINPLDQFPPAE